MAQDEGRLKALGAWIFAGGFTLGVRESFDVLAHLEETSYGVATVRRNLPDLPVHVGRDRWPLDALSAGPRIDFLYGNPPCAAWSPAGSKIVGTRNWRTDPRVDCTRRHFELLERLRPRAWAWESVPQAFTVGRELVDELTLRALALGYSVTYLLHNAMHCGVPQNRRRFLFVATDCRFNVAVDDWETETVTSALRRVNDPGELVDHNCKKYPVEVAETRQGETLISSWTRLHPESTWERNVRGHVRGRPVFTIKRTRADAPAPVVMHELIHPTEHRALGVNELKVLCGFPSWYEFLGLSDVGQISRGVCPPVGAWLARNVARCLELNEREAPTVRLIDVSRPPGAVTELPHPSCVQVKVVDHGQEVSHVPEFVEFEETVGPSLTPAAADLLVSLPLPSEGERSGAFIRRLILTHRYDTAKIVEAVRSAYPLSKAGASDVAWQRGWLRKNGQATEAVKADEATAPTAVSLSVEEVTKDRQLLRTGERASNDPERKMDKSSLRANAHGQWQHRDYAAHWFRWTWAGRFVNSSVEVLDVGMGPDVSMVSVLTMPRSSVPKRYVGVDLNRQPRSVPSRQWAELHWEFDFLERSVELGQFDLVTCFEMIEHVYRPDGLRLLRALRDCLKPDGTLLLSTPVFNGKAAAAHLHEWEIDELREAIEGTGLRVEQRFGTFASANDIKRVATPEELKLIEQLAKFHSGETMACFLAPKYPDASRNNVWKIRKC